MNFLHFKAVSVRDITMLRFMIEPSVAHLAALVRSQDDIQRLRELVNQGDGDHTVKLGREISFHRYLARMIGNPMLTLIMDFLDNLLRDIKEQLELPDDFYSQVKDSHKRILDCMIAEDCVGARREMAADLLAVGDSLAQAMGEPPFDPAVLGFSRQARYQGCPGDDRQEKSLSVIKPAGLALLADGQLDAKDLKEAMLLRHVGSGDIYMIVPKDKGPEKE